MSEYIDREALGVGFCNPDVFDDKGYAKGWNAAIDIIKKAPAAVERPVVRGDWKSKSSDHGNYVLLACSCCGMKTLREFNYCPNCGAEMKET